MAVTFDARTTGSNGAGTSLTVSHTAAADADCVIFCIYWLSDAGRSLASATWAGSNLSSVGSATVIGAVTAAIYQLTGITTGTQNAVVSFNGPPGTIALLVATYKGVNQSSPCGTPQTTTGNSNSFSLSVSSASGNIVVDALNFTLAATATVGANQTEMINLNVGGANDVIAVGSREDGASSVTMSIDLSTSRNGAYIAVDLQAAGGGGGATASTLNRIERKHMRGILRGILRGTA